MNHAIDEIKARAFALCAAADNALREGSAHVGKKLMSEAAALDATYLVRAEYFGEADQRTVRVAPAIRRILRPELESSGFFEDSRNYFIRNRTTASDSIYVGRDKFGGRLGLLAAVCVGKSDVVHFDWKLVGNRSGSLAYKTQVEVEAACRHWVEIVRTHVLPWFDRHV